MHESPLPAFAGWSNFYTITGSSAAALTGLMFVVVTLIVDRSRSTDAAHEGTSIFSTPTVVHFCAAFLISGLMAVPWQALLFARITLGFAGASGLAYVLHVIYRTFRLTSYRPVLEDWIWFATLPLVAYVVALTSAIGLRAPAAPFGLAGATLLLIFIGIHNSWDIVTYLALEQVQDTK